MYDIVVKQLQSQVTLWTRIGEWHELRIQKLNTQLAQARKRSPRFDQQDGLVNFLEDLLVQQELNLTKTKQLYEIAQRKLEESSSQQ